MKNIKFNAECVYRVRSYASANTLYFEDRDDHQLFFDQINYFLSDMIEIIEYVLLPTGWSMLIRTQSAKKIKKAFWQQRNHTKKNIFKTIKVNVGLMISEHFRFAISHYVKRSNKLKGRHGSKIHSRMEKVAICNMRQFEGEKTKMQAMEEFCEQLVARYRVDIGEYDDRGMEGRNWLKVRDGGARGAMGAIICRGVSDLVVRKWLLKTKFKNSTLIT